LEQSQTQFIDYRLFGAVHATGIQENTSSDSHLTLAAFSCHDQGASSLVYAPQHQLVISAGKKGDVCIIDVRQRQLRHRFQAHESPIKCLAIDPGEEFFVTGSADGDIKVRTEFIGTV
jgi:WD40 repeat protein